MMLENLYYVTAGFTINTQQLRQCTINERIDKSIQQNKDFRNVQLIFLQQLKAHIKKQQKYKLFHQIHENLFEIVDRPRCRS